MKTGTLDPMRFRDRLFEAIVVGLAVGFTDLLLLQFNVGGSRGNILYIPPSIYFSVPLTWTAVCILLAVFFTIPPLRRFWPAALTCAGPGLLLLSRAGVVVYRRHVVSIFMIIAGWLLLTATAALIASRWRLDYDKPAYRVPKILAYLIVVGLTVGCVATLDQSMHGRRTSAPESPHPNIVLVVLDTVRDDDVAASMPNLEAFARRSITFENAWAPAPWTLPSHLAIFTGQAPWAIAYDPTAGSFKYSTPTLAQRFSREGYSTAAIFANPILNPDTGLTRGFSHLEFSESSGLSKSGIGLLLSRLHFYGGPRIPGFAWLSGDDVTESAIQFVRRARGPYFMALNFIDAHYPYYVDPACRDAHFESFGETDRTMFLRGVEGGFDTSMPAYARAAARMHSQYRAAMACLDRSLGTLIEQLQREPDSRRTVVAIVSDHGEQFGEHKFTEHGNTLFRQVLHVPLIVSIPDMPPARITAPVSTTDLYPTLLQAAGFEGGAATLTLLEPQKRRPVISFQDAFKHVEAFSIVSGDDQFLQWATGETMLYHYRLDPDESHPVNPKSLAIAPSLQKALEAEWQKGSTEAMQFHALGYFQ